MTTKAQYQQELASQTKAGAVTIRRMCPDCKGDGISPYQNADVCAACHGDGTILVSNEPALTPAQLRKKLRTDQDRPQTHDEPVAETRRQGYRRER